MATTLHTSQQATQAASGPQQHQDRMPSLAAGPILCLCILGLLFSGPALAQSAAPASPEAQGVSSKAILKLVEVLEEENDAVHSFILMRRGQVIAEGWWAPYEAKSPHMLYSLSKSFAATGIGLLVDEGKLKLDDTVASFFPDQLPADPSDNLMAMRVRDLLCMGTGNHNDTFGALRNSDDKDWIKAFLARPVEHEPGTHFRYNTGATYMLSAILQQVSGETLLDYLTPRLFEPLGITGATWEMSKQGIHTGGYGLKVKTQDIAKLGQLYLQKGMWQGKRVLSKSWVAAATSTQISNGDNPKSDWNQGYGFQFWRCRHNAFRGDGAFGQYCVVMPDQEVVLAITSGLGNMQKVLDQVWDHLLPGIGDKPLLADPKALAALRKRCATLRLPAVEGEASSPKAADYLSKTYRFAENEKALKTLRLEADAPGHRLVLENAHGKQEIRCGKDAWQAGTLSFEKDVWNALAQTHGKQAIGSSGAWVQPDRYQATIHFAETPFRLIMTLQFKGEQLFLNLEYNHSFGGKKKLQLTGTRE